MKKRWISLFVLGLLAVSLFTGCATGNSTSEPTQSTEAEKVEFPTKPINLIVAFGAGGGTDIGARLLVPYLEKELGTTVNVLNKPGAAGWVGWTELLNSDSDGYTIACINSPSMIPGYLDPQYKRDSNLDSFDLIANQVMDIGAFAINPNETRFTDAKSLIEYAKNNEVTCAQDGVGSDDWIAMTRFNQLYNTKFTSVATKSTAESIANLMGGNVDVVFANIGELKVPNDNKEIKVVTVMNPERSDFLPEVPSTKELGFEIYSSSSRGYAAPAGLDPQVKEILITAFENAINNPEHIAKLKEMGLEAKFIKGDEYRSHLEADEKNVISVKWWQE